MSITATIEGKTFAGWHMGRPLYEDASLVIEDGFAAVERTWRERLFTLPWHPWGRAKDIQLWKPDPTIYVFKPDGRNEIAQFVDFGGEIWITHPHTASQLKLNRPYERKDP